MMTNHPGPVITRNRVLLVEDHALVRQGIAQLLNLEPDFFVCGEAEDASSALEAVRELKPDVVFWRIFL